MSAKDRSSLEGWSWRSLADVLEPSDERRGYGPELELLTCTEGQGLVLQRTKFLKRVAAANTAKYKIVREGDFVYNPYLLWAGAINQCWVVEKGMTSPVYQVLRPKPNVDSKFLGYLLTKGFLSNKYDSISLGTIERRRRAPIEDFLRLQVHLPPGNEQRSIGTNLCHIERKITVNSETNSTLASLIARLFAASFIEPSTTCLPKGWREGTLGDVAENPRRGVQPDEIKTATPYIGLEHMPRRCIALSDWGHADELESNKFEFKRGEILFGKLRPYFHKVGIAPLDGVCSTDILVITPKEPAWFGFVLGHVSSVELVKHTDAASTGTKMPRSNWNDIARYEVALPPETLAAKFSQLIQPLIGRIIANIHESRTLAALRDALLPKLLSGELRLPVAKFTEAT